MGYGCYVKGGQILTDCKNSEKMAKALIEACVEADETKKGVFDVWGCEYCNYHEENYQEVADLAKPGSYLQFIGEDDSVWTLYLSEGSITDQPGELIFDINDLNKFSIELDNGYKLVAQKNSDPDYNEIFVYLEKDGVATQDLAIVGERYTYDSEDGHVIPLRGIYDVKVYADPQNEDYTDQFIFGRYEEEE